MDYDDLNDTEDIEEVPLGVPVKLAGGLEVTVNKRARNCVRQVSNKQAIRLVI